MLNRWWYVGVCVCSISPFTQYLSLKQREDSFNCVFQIRTESVPLPHTAPWDERSFYDDTSTIEKWFSSEMNLQLLHHLFLYFSQEFEIQLNAFSNFREIFISLFSWIFLSQIFSCFSFPVEIPPGRKGGGLPRRYSLKKSNFNWTLITLYAYGTRINLHRK